MKKLLPCSALLLLIICIAAKPAKAQDVATDPSAYMNAISDASTSMNKAYMAYVSAAAHSNRKRKIEKMRDQAVESILACQSTINYMTPFKGDDSYRKASLKYVQLCYKVFNDDYAHIVDMEDIAQRSYDDMQAFLLLQQATNDTLQVAVKKINQAQKDFGAKYGVNIIDQKSELSDKMEISNHLSLYRNKVFLLFFKCNWEDNQLSDAFTQKNVTKIEQIRSALDKYAIEGLAILDTLKGFDNDGALVDACRQALSFYKGEAETELPKLTNFFLLQENFDKLKATMDAKGSQRTQQDVDAFNKAVADINAAANTSNQVNADLNNGRNDVNKNWMETDAKFTDNHTPYYNG
jgi:hypothetical protein